MRLKTWSTEETVLLKTFYPTLSGLDLKSKFNNRSLTAIKTRAGLLKIKKAVGFGAKKYWSDADLDYLKTNYSDTENRILCERFNCTEKSLYSAANELDVRKSPEHISKICGAVLREVGKNSRFKPGVVAFNKGKKWNEIMSDEAQENCRKTTFKKGRLPHNTVALGHERLTKDGYLEVKIVDGLDTSKNFQLKHRIVWESYHGKVPKGHQVRFIDGDKMNFDIENLKLVSLSESLRINSMSDSSIVKRFLGVKDKKLVDKIINESNDLIQIKRSAIKLNQKIKQHERKN